MRRLTRGMRTIIRRDETRRWSEGRVAPVTLPRLSFLEDGDGHDLEDRFDGERGGDSPSRTLVGVRGGTADFC